MSYKLQNILLLLSGILVAAWFSSCEEPFAPKPRGYFRIQLPSRRYVPVTPEHCPFSYEAPAYAVTVRDTTKRQDCWLNVEYPPFKGTLYLSYRPVEGNLEELTDDCRNMAMKHVIKASGIEESMYADPENAVYGLQYDLRGSAASPLQFWLTDSTRHFVRGSLYFYAVPNPDSIAPVLDYVRKDVLHMIESFRWKKSETPKP
jgi:gliding motility-associated lipoprotein GldD